MKQEFTQELKNIFHDNLKEIHTAVPGKILSFDPNKCEAVVKPTAKYRLPDNSLIDFPDISHVPVYFPQSAGQTATFVYPIQQGDECLLFFSEQALDFWRTGAKSDTDLSYDLTNAIAIVGLFAKPNPIVSRACENKSIIIQRENSFTEWFDKKIEVETDGDICVTAADNISINSGTNIEITASANIIITAAADMTLESKGNMTLRAARIDLNP